MVDAFAYALALGATAWFFVMMHREGLPGYAYPLCVIAALGIASAQHFRKERADHDPGR